MTIETPSDMTMEVPRGKELRCPHWTDATDKLPGIGTFSNFRYKLLMLESLRLVKGKINWSELTSCFEERNDITKEAMVEYLSSRNVFIGRRCNRLFCEGEASEKPQRFKCYQCKRLTTFRLVK